MARETLTAEKNIEAAVSCSTRMASTGPRGFKTLPGRTGPRNATSGGTRHVLVLRRRPGRVACAHAMRRCRPWPSFWRVAAELDPGFEATMHVDAAQSQSMVLADHRLHGDIGARRRRRGDGGRTWSAPRLNGAAALPSRSLARDRRLDLSQAFEWGDEIHERRRGVAAGTTAAPPGAPVWTPPRCFSTGCTRSPAACQQSHHASTERQRRLFPSCARHPGNLSLEPEARRPYASCSGRSRIGHDDTMGNRGPTPEIQSPSSIAADHIL